MQRVAAHRYFENEIATAGALAAFGTAKRKLALTGDPLAVAFASISHTPAIDPAGMERPVEEQPAVPLCVVPVGSVSFQLIVPWHAPPTAPKSHCSVALPVPAPTASTFRSTVPWRPATNWFPAERA